MARPLKIPVGLDFARFDRDLQGIADKIEGVGKAASVKLGGSIGAIGAGSLDTAALGDAVSQVGIQLSTGIANGIRSASASMMGFTSHIDAMLNRLAGTAITLFERIDAAMKFPRFDAFFAASKLTLSRWVTFWRKPLTDIDLAMGGVFGDKIAMLTRVLKSLIDALAASISGALKLAISEVVTQFALMNQGAKQTEASAELLLGTIQKTATAANQFDMGSKGMKGTVPGPKLKVKGQEPPMPTFGLGDPRRGPIAGGAEALAQLKNAFVTVGRVGGPILRDLGGVAAVTASQVRALASIGPAIALNLISPIRSVIAFFRGMGGVSKRTYDDIYGGSKRSSVAITAMAAPLNLVKSATASVGQTAKGLGSIFGGVGTQILAAFGFAGLIYKTVQFLRDGVMAASDLNESVSRSKNVFQNSFAPVENQVNSMSRAFGLSRKELYDMESGFGAIASGAGFTEKAAADLSMRMTKMAADLSSSVNIPLEEAGVAIRAALAGESEPLRRFGVNMLDANVKAYALKSGIAASAKEMTDQQKIMARAGLVTEGLKYAVDDLQKTQGAAANQFRKAGGGVTEFGARIGQVLLPAVTMGTQMFNELLASVLQFFDNSMPTIMAWGESIKGAFDVVGLVVRNLGSIWEIAQIRIEEFVANSWAWFDTLVPNFGRVTEWLGKNWWNLLTDMVSGAATVFTNLLTNARNFGTALWSAIQGNGFEFAFQPLLDGFKATTDALPELIQPNLVNVEDRVNAVMDKIAAVESGRLAAVQKAGEGATAIKPPAVPGADAMDKAGKQQEYKLASVAEAGSKEAASILARAASPGAQKDVQKQGLNVAKDSNATLKKIEQKLTAPVQLAVK